MDIFKERTKETVLANINLIPAYDVPRTENVGLPTKFRLNAGPASQPIAGSMVFTRKHQVTRYIGPMLM